MVYATEFFDVQTALGIENVSNVSSAPFKALDEKFINESRLEDAEKNVLGFGLVRAIFVDGNLIVCKINGLDVDADAAEVREVLEM